MYITKLVVEEVALANDSPALRREEINAPSWEAIEAAIRALDNDRKTLVMLQADEDHWIGFGGGGAGERYLVTVTDDETYYLAVLPAAPAVTIRLVVGGQAVDYPARECVDLTTTLRAARAYALVGALDPSTVWERT